MAFELLADLLELAVQGSDDLDQGLDAGAIGFGDHAWRLQLGGAQGGLQLGGAALQAPLATGPAQDGDEVGPRQASPKGRGWRHLEDGQGIAVAHLGADGDQRLGVELPQQAAELVELPSAGPDQALMGYGPAP
jgi:hypothetical protein